MLKRTLQNCNLGLVFIFFIYLWSYDTIAAVEYGPSLASLTGVFVNWKGPDIFALESGRKVKLSQYPSFSTVIPLITDNSQATSEQIFRERGISTVGEFVVEAPPTFGLIAVIQQLKLRKSTKDRGYNSSSCLDYIQFAELRTNGLGPVTPKICGTVRRDDTSLKPAGVIGPRTFMSSGGKIRIAFNHAYVSELVDALLAGSSQRKKPVLKVEIAFTAYTTNCSEELIVGTNGTIDENTQEYDSFEACNDYSSLMNQTCISSKLLCDDIFNCGGDNDTIGSDEQQALCPDKPARTTEKEDEAEDQTEKPSALQNLLNLGSYYSSSAGSQSPFQEQRKFKTYVPPSESGSQQENSQHPRRPYSLSRPSYSMSNNNQNNNQNLSKSQGQESSDSSPSSVSGENLVRPIGAFSSKTSGSDAIENPPKRLDLLNHGEDPAYGRRELADAINSVIYGVALFIVFTIFITLFVIYIGRRIQMNLSQRNSRNSMTPVVGAVSTPSIRPSTTTAVITRDNASCNGGQSRELAFSSSNTTVVLVTLPQHSQNSEGFDAPPSYDTLFPQQNSAGMC